jgi:vacuolar-type H+-ATPase subunit I/STV1
VVKHSLQVVANLDAKKDSDQFLIEYQKLDFIKPKRIYYENRLYGQCKDILFGSNLNDYAIDHQRTVPLLVTKCIEAVETQGGLEKEGIYRISGRQTYIDQLKGDFEKDEEAVDLVSKDVFTIASVLKVYLRELKQPLFNLTMQERIEYSSTCQNMHYEKLLTHPIPIEIADESKRKEKLQKKISDLSKIQRDTLKSVIAHLAK